MSEVSTLTSASRRKRLAYMLIAIVSVTSLGACGNDDDKTAAAPASLSAAVRPADNAATVLPAMPSADSPAPSALTIQSPAMPASGDDPGLSAAATAPLVTPVVHTVD
ncbi:hypothetical protein [Paraburkholderia sp. BCC1886]|uniref:hypothetical protein n=1 Tax=Paraburkholderia sp. BCC1886 TaxID=2562670 RepID=UPI0016434386|nr:hypothetical protein [Paraburkholderia sp. BCC1886]